MVNSQAGAWELEVKQEPGNERIRLRLAGGSDVTKVNKVLNQLANILNNFD